MKARTQEEITKKHIAEGIRMASGLSDEARDPIKVENLAIAGYVAPRMRSQPESVRMRRVGRLDKDGNVIGYTTVEEMNKALLRRQEIEFDVADGVRPKATICKACGVILPVKKGLPVRDKCKNCRYRKCEVCKQTLSYKHHSSGAKYCSRTCSYPARRKHPINHCTDCKKQLGRHAANGVRRCIDCHRSQAKHPKEVKCIECGAALVSKLAKRCQRCSMVECHRQRRAVRPSVEVKCQECGVVLVNRRSKRCRRCFMVNRHKQRRLDAPA